MTQVNKFSERLDTIFKDGDPTKALIIDALTTAEYFSGGVVQPFITYCT